MSLVGDVDFLSEEGEAGFYVHDLAVFEVHVVGGHEVQELLFHGKEGLFLSVGDADVVAQDFQVLVDVVDRRLGFVGDGVVIFEFQYFCFA